MKCSSGKRLRYSRAASSYAICTRIRGIRIDMKRLPMGWSQSSIYQFKRLAQAVPLFLPQCQPRVAQIQPVHDLVVIVSWRGVGVAGKRVRVGSLEENHLAAFLVEHGMLLGIVEAVAIVGRDLDRDVPGADRRLG